MLLHANEDESLIAIFCIVFRYDFVNKNKIDREIPVNDRTSGNNPDEI